MKHTREELLALLVDVLGPDADNHPDVVENLSDLLTREAKHSVGEPWVAELIRGREDSCARIVIEKVSTGERREILQPFGGDAELLEFIWTEGSCCCDCSRESLFRRAGGEDPDYGTSSCEDSRFHLVTLELDGEDVL